VGQGFARAAERNDADAKRRRSSAKSQRKPADGRAQREPIDVTNLLRDGVTAVSRSRIALTNAAS
jgi:hypothetical protein